MLVAMGFDLTAAQRALESSGGDFETAVEGGGAQQHRARPTTRGVHKAARLPDRTRHRRSIVTPPGQFENGSVEEKSGVDDATRGADPRVTRVPAG